MATKKEVKRNKIPTEQDFRDCFEQGLSNQEISDALGVNNTRISNIRWFLGYSVKTMPIDVFGRKVGGNGAFHVNMKLLPPEFGVDGDKLSNLTWRVSKIGNKKLELEFRDR